MPQDLFEASFLAFLFTDNNNVFTWLASKVEPLPKCFETRRLSTTDHQFHDEARYWTDWDWDPSYFQVEPLITPIIGTGQPPRVISQRSLLLSEMSSLVHQSNLRLPLTKKTEHFWRDMEGKKSHFCRLEFKLHRQIILLNFVRFKLRICTVLCYLDLIWYNISDSNGHYHFIELVTKLDCSLMEKDRGGWGNSLPPHPGNSWVAKGTSGRDTEGAERRKLKECPFVILSQCFV